MFSPLIRALSAFVENSHRFISGSYLYLHKVRSLVSTTMTSLFHCDLINVLPGLSSSEHVINLFPLQRHLFLKGLRDNEYVGAGFAKEAELNVRLLDKEKVGAGWTEEHRMCGFIYLYIMVSLSNYNLQSL